jgi:hypothetical protein
MVSTNWTPIMSTQEGPSDESAGSGRLMTINASMIINKPMQGAHGRLGAMPRLALGLCVGGQEYEVSLLDLVWMHVYPPQSTCVGVEWNVI